MMARVSDWRKTTTWSNPEFQSFAKASKEVTTASRCQMQEYPLLQYFLRIVDPRKSKRAKKHMLADIIAMAICAVIAGADDWLKIATFAQERKDWLAGWLNLSQGVPSHDTFERLFQQLSPQALQNCFLNWANDTLESSSTPHFAIDGKTLRGSKNPSRGERPLHLVNVWASDSGIRMGQHAVAKKSNEITAIPVLLDMLDVEGTWITIDAMGCQKDIAAKIVDCGGKYLLAVKHNQSRLAQDVTEAFTQAQRNQYAGLRTSSFYTEETAHGRLEKRQYSVICKPKTLRDLHLWKKLEVIGKCESQRSCQKKTSQEVRYFIGSEEAEAKLYGELLRRHWQIENNLHWQLDVTFHEDRSRIRHSNAAQNFSLLRGLALCLLKRHPAKLSIANKRWKAALNVEFLHQILSCDYPKSL